MENVKYSNFQDDNRNKVVKRFIVTEPYEWGIDPRPLLPPEDKAKLRQQFFNDPDVKESILSHIQAVGRMDQFKFDRDRVVAESTLYPDFNEDFANLKHQNSMTILKGSSQQRNHYSEQ